MKKSENCFSEIDHVYFDLIDALLRGGILYKIAALLKMKCDSTGQTPIEVFDNFLEKTPK